MRRSLARSILAVGLAAALFPGATSALAQVFSGTSGGGGGQDTNASADLSVTETTDRSGAAVGEEIAYTLEVGNAGPNPSKHVLLEFTVPDNVEFVDAEFVDPEFRATGGGCSVAKVVVSCPLGTLAVRARARRRLRLRVTKPGAIVPGVSASSTAVPPSSATPDPNRANNTAPRPPNPPVALLRPQPPRPPQTGTLNVYPLGPGVLVRLPGDPGFRPLTGAENIPVNSLVDVSVSAVELESARDFVGGIQTAIFAGGIFQVLQKPEKTLVTEVGLFGGDFSVCRRARRSVASAAARRVSRRIVRRLFAAGTGNFRTRGRYGSAAVRGTSWSTDDRCDGTFFRAFEGTLLIEDFPRKRRKILSAPGSYLARPAARR